MEDRDRVSNLLCVQWTILPETEPRPWIDCHRCGRPRPFQSSKRIRLNANGKKLDAWLIYRCVVCEETWNRPVIERRNVRDIEPAVLARLEANDTALIQMYAFDIGALKSYTQRVDQAGRTIVTKRRKTPDPQHCFGLRIDLNVPISVGIRLDRLLANQLHLSRSRLDALSKATRLKIEPGHTTTLLRRRIRHGTMVLIDLSNEADKDAIAKWSTTSERPV